jgi:hypothetical protein
MSRIHPKCPESDSADRSVAATVLLRQDTDDEEDEEEDEDDGNQDDDDDDEGTDDGYSVSSKSRATERSPVWGVLKPLKGMAGTTRLELATSAVTGQRSNQLNYVPASRWWAAA